MPEMRKVRLGVNLDHVATLRQARRTSYPDLADAIRTAENAGADGITLHLREDRRHIQDEDIYAARDAITTSLNFEMAAIDEMAEIALAVKPDCCCVVPEKREELTTEGGLDIAANPEVVKNICASLAEQGIVVSLFVEADRRAIEAAARSGAAAVEIHTGQYANATGDAAMNELARIVDAAQYAVQCGLTVNAGHGLHRGNVHAIAQIKEMHELNIGHAIVADAIFMGLAGSIAAMRQAMQG